MRKVCLDVPTLGYKTWVIAACYVNENGEYIEPEVNDFLFLDDLGKEYPYNKENPHIN